MTHIITITRSGQPAMYVESDDAGGTLFTGNRADARRYSREDAITLLVNLPVKSLPGVAEMEAA